jgi:hypothetical protein
MLGATTQSSSASFPRPGRIHISDPMRRRASTGPGHGDKVVVIGPDPNNTENVLCEVRGVKQPISRRASNIKYDS